jgi:hypothetical protein
MRSGRVPSITQSSQRSQIPGCELYANIICSYFAAVENEDASVAEWQPAVEDSFLAVLATVPE